MDFQLFYKYTYSINIRKVLSDRIMNNIAPTDGVIFIFIIGWQTISNIVL